MEQSCELLASIRSGKNPTQNSCSSGYLFFLLTLSIKNISFPELDKCNVRVWTCGWFNTQACVLAHCTGCSYVGQVLRPLYTNIGVPCEQLREVIAR